MQTPSPRATFERAVTTIDAGANRIIVVGTSAGAVEALSSLLGGLPENLPAAVLIVYHQSPHGNSYMPQILRRKSKLPVSHAVDGEMIQAGHVYLARPDHHLLVKPGYIRLTRGPHENNSRPAVDPLFRTAAAAYREQVIGVILTGNLGDGTSGLAAIKANGGVAIVQDPGDAPYPGMPQSAVNNVQVDYVVPLEEIANLLVQLSNQPRVDVRAIAQTPPEITDPAEELEKNPTDPAENEKPSVYTCPLCHGTLFEVSDPGQPLVFRCRVGHAYAPEVLSEQQSERIDEALWIALRSLEERASLADRLSQRSIAQGHPISAERFRTQAAEVRRRAALLRKVLRQGNVDAPDEDLPESQESAGG